jgi:quercetin dioxygenase-like cupin family protein
MIIGEQGRVWSMLAFDLNAEQVFNAERHVEKILAVVGEGDVTVACWEPGQVSPNHLHPNATEIYFCVSGGGVMRTPSGDVDVKPGCFVVHPRGELHEYVNGPSRTLLFRIRYGGDMSTRSKDWPTNGSFQLKADDAAFFRDHPDGVTA